MWCKRENFVTSHVHPWVCYLWSHQWGESYWSGWLSLCWFYNEVQKGGLHLTPHVQYPWVWYLRWSVRGIILFWWVVCAASVPRCKNGTLHELLRFSAAFKPVTLIFSYFLSILLLLILSIISLPVITSPPHLPVFLFLSFFLPSHSFISIITPSFSSSFSSFNFVFYLLLLFISSSYHLLLSLLLLLSVTAFCHFYRRSVA